MWDMILTIICISLAAVYLGLRFYRTLFAPSRSCAGCDVGEKDDKQCGEVMIV